MHLHSMLVLNSLVYICTLYYVLYFQTGLNLNMENNFVDLGFNNCFVNTCTYVDYLTEPSPNVTSDRNPFTVLQFEYSRHPE